VAADNEGTPIAVNPEPAATERAGEGPRPGSRVRFPDAVIGRDDVLTTLEQRVAKLSNGGRSLVVLEGESGIGKSTVLREMRRRVLAAGGLVAGGEFGARPGTAPTSGLRGAVGDLVNIMLGLSDAQMEEWLFNLRNAVGGSVEPLADLVPELALLPSGEPLRPVESPTGLRNRLRLAVLSVVRATANRTRPLVITLDDFDRADGESMQIVHDVMRSDADGLLVLATARPDTLDGLPILDDPTTGRIRLAELTKRALRSFLAAALETRVGANDELASLVSEFVGANPLAVLQFLQRAVAGGGLARRAGSAAWHWDEPTLRALDRTPTEEDIAESALSDIRDVEVIEVASCLGEHFRISTLAGATGRSIDGVAETVLQALERGVVMRRSATEPGGVFLDSSDEYRFVHERVQRAVRSRLSSNRQAAVHLRVGRALRGSERLDDLFGAARHLNQAVDLLPSESDRMELAALDARAAGRARQTAAFALALELANAGLACLPDDADARDHTLVLALHLTGAEAAWITGDLDRMLELVGAVRSLQTTALERAELAFLEVKGLAAAERPAEALRCGRAALEELGVRLPAGPTRRHVLATLPSVWRRLRHRSDADLLALPEATDPQTLWAQKLLAEMFGPAYMADPDLWPLLALRCLTLTIDGGRAPVSPVAFAGYGLLLAVTGRYDAAKRFGDLAMRMAEAPESREFRPWTKFLFYDFIHHWTRPAADAIEPLREAGREALLIGDLENAGFMTAVELYQSLAYGVPLPEIDARGLKLAVHLRPYRAQFSLCESTRQMAHNLMGRSADRFELAGETAYDERVAVPLAVERHDVTALTAYHLTRLGLHLWYGDFEGGLPHARKSEEYLVGMRGTPNVPIFHMSNAIVRLRAAPNEAGTRRAVRRARDGYRTWARTSPDNYQAPALLIEAEVERAAGHDHRAETLYDEAIEAADRSGLVTIGALAREFAAELHAEKRRDLVARSYLAAAVESWATLGADGKVDQLTGRHPGLLRPPPGERPYAGTGELIENTIAGELGLDELLEQLLIRVGHETGAERGILFVNDGAALVPRLVLDEHGSTTEPSAVHDAPGYGASVVRYVERSDRPVLIADTAASVHGRDPHLRATGVRSVLCVPVARGGVLRAIVYLESRVASAFELAHVESLRLLSAHVATALENAHLLRRLEDALTSQTDLVFAQSRFIPEQLLQALGRDNLIAIEAGDAVVREMTLLYSDIRGYTNIQEGLDPRHGITFLNDYLRHMEPPVVAHGGFVNSYVGDGMIAAFDRTSDGALRAALAMRRTEREVTLERRARGLEPVRTGIAIHTGDVVLGTFGGVNQLRCGVVGDAVNLAARLEGLTRDYGSLLISESARAGLEDPAAYDLRRIGSFRVVGRTSPVTVWEVFDEDEPALRSAKRTAAAAHDAALEAFAAGRIADASAGFEELARIIEGDKVAAAYLAHCRDLEHGLPDGWDGVISLDHK
jgi:predicted ATPase/class 3 adenylate cyclase